MEFRVAMHSYDVIYIRGEIQSAPRVFGVLCGVWWYNKYKGMHKRGVEGMDRIYVYGYVSFGLVSLFLIGLIVFSWLALQKICQCSFR
jgi:hypothetical protein